jgi:hypothetical protein
MATTWKKSKLGKQDIFFDDAGTLSTVSVEKSDGTNRTVNKINASHIPLTATTRAEKSASNVALTSTDVDAAIAEFAVELLSIGVPDGITLDATTTPGTLVVKLLGIAAAQLASNAVITAKINAAAVTNAKLEPTSATASVAGSASGASGTNVIEAASVAAADIELLTITKALMAANSIGVDELDMDTSGNPPVAFPLYFGKYTWDAGVATTQDIAVSGTLTSDTVLAQFQDVNASAVSIDSAYVSTAGNVKIICDGTAQDNDIVGYFVFRATA